ncbi:polysaccharide pyruvyl transferase family protein [Neobacillus jeddahensis]|uniref:polysaccharide pyruvyl transferase family protein n=1 Tax=Neobacillus jeddahensis TaxID=1461580 RepID=UPI00058DA736|nr:polysaccharide pyruvyl transferase family protein [Neobacillus jeddahensis]
MLDVINKLKLKVIYKIPMTLKLRIRSFFSKNNVPLVLSNGLKIFVAMAADYGNLGDVAITEAQTSFLKDYFPDYEIIPLYVKNLYSLTKLKKVITPSDIITTIGGGNMGDVYEGLENQRRYIIKSFPHNKIISFPQSIDFKKEKNLNKSIKIYSKHPNLHIFARELKSYELMKNSFKKNHIHLVPDIVFYINRTEPRFNRKGVIICLRNDLEGVISSIHKNSLIAAIEEKYQQVHFYDTVINDFSTDMANQKLEDIWIAFKQAKVVVTDRLHGMIFCAITKTPCIVFSNSNHKIISTYQCWLSDLAFIRYIKVFDIDYILEQINQLVQMEWKEDHEVKYLEYIQKFDLILESLRK